MFGKIAGFVFRAARWIMAAVGVLAVVAVILVYGFFSGGSDKAQAAIAAPAVVEMPASSPGQSCDCETGGACTGPRGGRYCLKPGGGKRYLSQ